MMKIVSVRALRENPGVLSQSAGAGEYVLVTNRNTPVSLSIPFNDVLLESGVHLNVAVKLYDEGLLTLVKAAKLAGLPVESFIRMLSSYGVTVAGQSAEELASDLDALHG